MDRDVGNSVAAADSSRKRDGFLGSLHAAFSSWWTLLGIIAASVSAFNIARNALEIELAALVAEIVGAYQGLIHAPVVWLFDRLHWPEPPTWAIDAVALWLLIGGVALRSAFALRNIALVEHRKLFAASMLGPQTQRIWSFLTTSRSALGIFVLYCVLLWPLAVSAMLHEPIVLDHGKALHTWRRRPPAKPSENSTDIADLEAAVVVNSESVRHVLRGDADFVYQGEYLFDMRVVLAMQAMLAIIGIAAWVALNAALTLYGQ